MDEPKLSMAQQVAEAARRLPTKADGPRSQGRDRSSQRRHADDNAPRCFVGGRGSLGQNSGKDYQTEEHVVGYYKTGDRMMYWGKLGAFWGGFGGGRSAPLSFGCRASANSSWPDRSSCGSSRA